MPHGMQHQLTLLPQMGQMVRPPQLSMNAQQMQQALMGQQMLRPTMALPPGKNKLF